jgi:hypothetical protein
VGPSRACLGLSCRLMFVVESYAVIGSDEDFPFG